MSAPNFKIHVWRLLWAAVVFKLPFIFKPLSGYFASYQATNAMMAATMSFAQPASLFIPNAFLWMGGGLGLHLLYYPFASLFADFFHLFRLDLVASGRLQAILCMLCAGYFLFKMVRNYLGPLSTVVAVFLFSFSPMILLSGISFQNEAFALWMLLMAISISDSHCRLKNWILAGLLFSLAMTARLHFLVYYPVFGLILLRQKRGLVPFLVFGFASILPLCLWYAWTGYLNTVYPEHVITSLFSQAGEGRVLNSVLAQKEYYIHVIKVICGQALTPVAAFFFVIGFFTQGHKLGLFKLWALCALATCFLLPQKVFDHPFYLIGFVAPSCVLAAYGIEKSGRLFLQPKFLILIYAAYSLFVLRFFLPPALSDWEEGLRLERIGKIVQRTIPADSLLIAEDGSSPVLLFYSSRYGWPLALQMDKIAQDSQFRYPKLKENGYGDLQKWLHYLISQGAKYLVISHPRDLDQKPAFKEFLLTKYTPVANEENSFIIVDLTRAPVNS